MMDFSLAESQQVVAELAADVLTVADPWKELARAGLLQLGVPETTVLLTEMGRHASPDSLRALATLMTGALPVARWGSASLQRELLPAIARSATAAAPRARPCTRRRWRSRPGPPAWWSATGR
jgi:3-oxo-4-pregnene-20-carboxyl-CoA dehydrogenase alpha subunit